MPASGTPASAMGTASASSSAPGASRRRSIGPRSTVFNPAMAFSASAPSDPPAGSVPAMATAGPFS